MSDLATQKLTQSQIVSHPQRLPPILPNSPVFSSRGTGWQGILLEQYACSAYEIPEYCFTQHKITLQTQTQDSIKIKRVLDDQVHSEHLVEGGIVIVPAHTPHQVCWNQPAEFMLLTLDPLRLAQSAHDSIVPDQVELIPRFPTFDPLIYHIGMALKIELLSQSTNESNVIQTDLFYVESLTTALAAHLLKHYVTRPAKTPAAQRLSKVMLNRAIAYIQDHLDQEIQLSDLAQHLGLSSCYFASLFKQSTGVSPYQFVIQRRLQKAQELLKTTHFSIAEIALHCGFSSQSHLTKLFRQQLGLTPTAYRKLI
ncbi:transcriptional regulator, AraC family [Leptolyngbya sp. NIES-3755]|nr:transcriptional regulator, AraC family [Leptolyngbya sp. NIES-3755]